MASAVPHLPQYYDGTRLTRPWPPDPQQTRILSSQVKTPTFSYSFSPAPSISPRKRSSCISTRAGRSRLVPSLHATQQSSCWQPPSASPPALMTFINELHSFWLLMKSASQTENEPMLLGTAFVYMAVWFVYMHM